MWLRNLLQEVCNMGVEIAGVLIGAAVRVIMIIVKNA